jgi:hypothetical protein
MVDIFIYFIKDNKGGLKFSTVAKEFGIHFRNTTKEDILMITLQIHFSCIFHGKQSEELFVKCDKGVAEETK